MTLRTMDEIMQRTNPASEYSRWLIAERFDISTLEYFRLLYAAGRLAHIGYCLPNGVTGNFGTVAEAEDWMRSGRNVYADVAVSEALSWTQVTA